MGWVRGDIKSFLSKFFEKLVEAVNRTLIITENDRELSVPIQGWKEAIYNIAVK
jgi:hypothetical protein